MNQTVQALTSFEDSPIARTAQAAAGLTPIRRSARRTFTDREVCRIRRLIFDKKLSLRDVAEIMDTSHITIRNIKEGVTYKEVRCFEGE